MKSKYILLFTVYCLLSTVFLWGCGGAGPGSPGSYGCEDVGLICEVTITPTYQDANTYSVDAFPDDCDPDPATVDPEYFADHSATATINLRLLNPGTTFQPGTLYIEKYTVEFRRSTDSIGAPPIQSDPRYKTIIIAPPTGTSISTVETTAVFVDLLRKNKYRTDVLSGIYSYGSAYINNYTASYTFEGQSMGKAIKIFGQTNFQIGNFDYCE